MHRGRSSVQDAFRMENGVWSGMRLSGLANGKCNEAAGKALMLLAHIAAAHVADVARTSLALGEIKLEIIMPW